MSKSLSVHLPAVRLVERPVDLHQDHEASGSQAQRARNAVGIIPGRHISHSQQPGTGNGPHFHTDLHIGEPGLYCSLREITDPTHPEGGVLDGTSSSRPENKMIEIMVFLTKETSQDI